MIYEIKYISDVERAIMALDEKCRTAFLEGMSRLVTNPFPKECVRNGHTAELNVTQFLRVTYMVSDRIIAVIAVIRLDDTRPYFVEET